MRQRKDTARSTCTACKHARTNAETARTSPCQRCPRSRGFRVVGFVGWFLFAYRIILPYFPLFSYPLRGFCGEKVGVFVVVSMRFPSHDRGLSARSEFRRSCEFTENVAPLLESQHFKTRFAYDKNSDFFQSPQKTRDRAPLSEMHGPCSTQRHCVILILWRDTLPFWYRS